VRIYLWRGLACQCGPELEISAHRCCSRPDKIHGSIHDRRNRCAFFPVWASHDRLSSVYSLFVPRRRLQMPGMRNSDMLPALHRRAQNEHGLFGCARQGEIRTDEPLHAWNHDGRLCFPREYKQGSERVGPRYCARRLRDCSKPTRQRGYGTRE
jgi:hypothetical protein